MRIFRDPLNREIKLASIPKRLVSLVPSQTELLVDLGFEKALKGVTKFCVHPAHLRKEKEVVGGTKQVHFDRIRALEPELIFCNKEENTEEMVQELEKIAPVHVSDIRSIEDSLDLIRDYGAILDVEKSAQELIQAIQKEVQEFQLYMKPKSWKKTVYLIWKKPWMATGGDTFIDQLMQLNKFENSFSLAASRYPEIDLTDLEKKEVEVILLATEPYPFKEEDRLYLQDRFPTSKVAIVDGEYFSWYGSRLRTAFQYFRELQGLHFSS